mgnify:FL=1
MNSKTLHTSSKYTYMFMCIKMKDFAKETSKYGGLMKGAFFLLVLWPLLASCEILAPTNATFEGEKYAVVVGINDYIDNTNNLIRDLDFCAADAEAMKDMLTGAGWQVELITAEANESIKKNATKEKIKTAFQKDKDGLTAFLFYFSGHGDVHEDQAYIVPSDAYRSCKSVEKSSMISATELSMWLKDLNANKIMIFDSCYSGGFVNPGDCIDAAPGNIESDQISTNIEMFFRFGEILAQNSASAARSPSTAPLVISASGSNEASMEDANERPTHGSGHGFFTYYFLQSGEASKDGSMKGDLDGDGILSCLEAYNYAKKALEKDWTASQLPHITGGLRDFALIDLR